MSLSAAPAASASSTPSAAVEPAGWPGAGPLIGFGQVHHSRLRPSRNDFSYPTCFLLLPMRRLAADPAAAGALALNRPGLLSFFDADHGDGRGPEQGGALAWLDELLRAEGISDADGEVWLHAYPRMLGHTFKPVSFWYCERADGSLRAIVAEVNNTFGERHCYLLEQPRYGIELQAEKVFHVSPFCELAGRYRFRFLRHGQGGELQTLVRVDHDDEAGPLLRTSVGGRLEPVTRASLRRALLGYPAMTLMIVWRIHWQALKLWVKRVRFHAKPAPPDRFLTR
ncbi:DUF1365 domain-containing protein [Malikia granosa]|uniref:DUF1365 domain-containing protein n=1 Tax=Malikia granosa TaxID=263067 RepID=A0A2S9K8X9_9BURK|nr:DUF1365 domain-containing protein [Malikia granosa]PRD66923.1 DUF1365 domain-containing protein [Malikia granosa]